MILFNAALALVLANEGGLVTSGQAVRMGDPGGATYKGITRRTLDGMGICRDPSTFTDEEVADFYRAHYWAPVSGVSLAGSGLALALMDAGVQHGPGRAVEWLQELVGANPDGQLGPETLLRTGRYVEEHGNGTLLLHYHARRRQFLLTWALSNGRRHQLVRGLIRRVDAVLLAALSVDVLASFKP